MPFTSRNPQMPSYIDRTGVAVAALLVLLCMAESAAGNTATGNITNSTTSISTDTSQQASNETSRLNVAYPYKNDSSVLHCWGWAASCLASGNDRPIFAFLGDSITAFGFTRDGWATKLSLAYEGQVNMVNYGVEAATTRRVDEVADRLLQQLGPNLHQVQLATIWFGANDAVTPRAPNWHLPIPQYKENLQRLVKRLQDKGIPRVVLITPPPVGRRGDRSNAMTGTYAQTVKEIAQEMQLPAVDVYSSILAVDKWQDSALDKDQLHLSPLGQEVVYNSLVQVLISSTDVGPAALTQAAPQQQQQQQQQPQKQVQQPQQQQSTLQDLTQGHHAMKAVLLAALALLFLAIVTEAKRQPQHYTKKESV